jgi:hypothetical protein
VAPGGPLHRGPLYCGPADARGGPGRGAARCTYHVRDRRLLAADPGLAWPPRRCAPALVLDALEQALWTRRQQCRTDLAGLIQHTDAGSVHLDHFHRTAIALRVARCWR